MQVQLEDLDINRVKIAFSHLNKFSMSVLENREERQELLDYIQVYTKFNRLREED